EAELRTFVMFRRLLLLAWIGSHGSVDVAQELAPTYAVGTCALAEEYLSSHTRRGNSRHLQGGSMFTSLEGRSVVVTGASKGIGKGIAAGFARAGAKVLVVGRDGDAASATAQELGNGASAFAADVADADGCAAMAAAATERYGGIDVLCANAGIFP